MVNSKSFEVVRVNKRGGSSGGGDLLTGGERGVQRDTAASTPETQRSSHTGRMIELPIRIFNSNLPLDRPVVLRKEMNSLFLLCNPSNNSRQFTKRHIRLSSERPSLDLLVCMCGDCSRTAGCSSAVTPPGRLAQWAGGGEYQKSLT